MTDDLVKRLLDLADCDTRAGEPLGRCMREAADHMKTLQAQTLRLSGMVYDLNKEVAISDALLISEAEASLARLERAEKAEAERDKAFKAHLLLRSYASHDDSCNINLYSEKPVCSCGLNSAWYAIDHQKRT